ncbi:hypothetical protein [Kribbella deserti]|uniref:Uncharacterized protein n=1 Tax=Kribbella deserti TaxID=1926257 RepID=A0ABV6QEP4_9ACTN
MRVGEVREVRFTTQPQAKAAKFAGIEVALISLALMAMPIFVPMPWWSIPLMILGGLFMLAFAAHLRFGEPASAADTTRLETEGLLARAEITDFSEIPDEGILYSISYRLYVDGFEPIDVRHRCCNEVCVQAVDRHARGESVAQTAFVSAVNGDWMISHRR